MKLTSRPPHRRSRDKPIAKSGREKEIAVKVKTSIATTTSVKITTE